MQKYNKYLFSALLNILITFIVRKHEGDYKM